ncbi:MAG: hypothetical protein M1819_002204 [Sarea resinae]|nr:MAG: hypothetical protein M1819_002204 [Sarea resinae]
MSIRPPSLTFLRAFSSTSSNLARRSDNLLAYKHRNVPPYPYGPSQWYKQSNFGLYGGQRIRYGNNVSDDTEIKTRRRFRPNIQRKKLYSVALQRPIRLRLSIRVLRTIDKVGGLDEYLLGEKPMRLKELGMEGWRLRWRLMQTKTVQEKFAEERRKLGLSEEAPAMLSSEGKPVSETELKQEIAEFDRELDENERQAEEEDRMDVNSGAAFMEEQPAPPKSRVTL